MTEPVFLTWMADNVVELIAAIGSLVAAWTGLRLLSVGRQEPPPIATIRLSPIEGAANWYRGIIVLSNRGPTPLRCVSLSVSRWSSAALLPLTDDLFAGQPWRRELQLNLPAERAKSSIPLAMKVAGVGFESAGTQNLYGTRSSHSEEFLLINRSRQDSKVAMTLSLKTDDQAERKVTISIMAVAKSHPAIPSN